MLSLSYNLSAQFFYPNGKKVDILRDSIEKNNISLHMHKLGVVYFRKLTNKPIYVVFTKTAYPSKIKEMISSYDYKRYINSYSYYYELNDMIRSGELSKDYLQTAFNSPDKKGQTDEGTEYWIYKKFNVKVIFRDSVPISADVINYNAIEKNELSISTFNVTGEDYTMGFNIGLTNLSSKVIKYVFVTVTATNAVNDKVGTKTVKGVGPIGQGMTGSYEFDDIFYSRVAEYLEIDGVKLQYMDGSIKNISKLEAKNIRLTDWEAVGQRTLGD